MQIADRCFIVTGGGSGLGAASARLLAELGARLVIADVDDKAGNTVAAALGDACAFVHCDITSEEDAAAALQTAGERFGPVRGLINCAGISDPARVLGQRGPMDLSDFTRVIQVNLVGSFNMIRLAAQAMAMVAPDADGERGVIINTASVAAFEGRIGQAAYAAAKAGVVGMTLPIARELARHQIRVMCIAPGLFDTAKMALLPAEARAALSRQVPYPARLGAPSEYARLVKDIIENPMLNGTTIRLDGAARI